MRERGRARERPEAQNPLQGIRAPKRGRPRLSRIVACHGRARDPQSPPPCEHPRRWQQSRSEPGVPISESSRSRLRAADVRPPPRTTRTGRSVLEIPSVPEIPCEVDRRSNRTLRARIWTKLDATDRFVREGRRRLRQLSPTSEHRETAAHFGAKLRATFAPDSPASHGGHGDAGGVGCGPHREEVAHRPQGCRCGCRRRRHRCGISSGGAPCAPRALACTEHRPRWARLAFSTPLCASLCVCVRHVES